MVFVSMVVEPHEIKDLRRSMMEDTDTKSARKIGRPAMRSIVAHLKKKNTARYKGHTF